MPSPRPQLVNVLVRRLPQVGKYVQAAYDGWTRSKFYRSWEVQNLPARQAFEEDKPKLTDVQCQILGDLNTRGVAHAHFNDLVDDRRLWDNLVAEVNRWLDSQEVKDKECAYKTGGYRKAVAKEYIIKMLCKSNEQPPLLSWDNQWLWLGLQPQIGNIVNSYMGLLSKLMHVDLWNTIPLEYDRPLTGSQRWHRDPEDIKLVKVFLYFTDVDLNSGPLHYVPNSRKGEKYGHLWPQQIPGGSIPPAGAVEAAVPCSEWEICTYPAGTLLFIDTTGLHMGGRATKRNRVSAVWEFTSHSSLWPRYFELGPLPAKRNLSAATRFALLYKA